MRFRPGFRELRAATLCRPWRRPLFGDSPWLQPTVNVYVWTDDDYAPGDELSVDVFPGDGRTVEFLARVEWVDVPGTPAAFRVGLKLAAKVAGQLEEIVPLLGERE